MTISVITHVSRYGQGTIHIVKLLISASSIGGIQWVRKELLNGQQC